MTVRNGDRDRDRNLDLDGISDGRDEKAVSNALEGFSRYAPASPSSRVLDNDYNDDHSHLYPHQY